MLCDPALVALWRLGTVSATVFRWRRAYCIISISWVFHCGDASGSWSMVIVLGRDGVNKRESVREQEEGAEEEFKKQEIKDTKLKATMKQSMRHERGNKGEDKTQLQRIKEKLRKLRRMRSQSEMEENERLIAKTKRKMENAIIFGLKKSNCLILHVSRSSAKQNWYSPRLQLLLITVNVINWWEICTYYLYSNI